jgi:hypothetical protein
MLPAKRTPFWSLFLLGMIGVLTLALVSAPQIQQQVAAIPDFPRVPLALLATLAVVQPTVLLAIAVWCGISLAPRLGLRSRVAQWAGDRAPVWAPLRHELPVSLTLGLATGITIVVLDAMLQPALAMAWKNPAEPPQPIVATALLGMLYGGITEELLTRWGLMSLLAWIVWRVFHPDRQAPGNAIFWVAASLAAMLFGAGHLPAMRAAATLNAPLIIRTVGLNALAAMVFGWLYWRRSLEAAMIAHASTHVVFTIARVALG